MDYKMEIEDLEIQISMLPRGYISKKNINGNLYHYRQWTENGKVKSKFIKKNELETVTAQIAKRKELEQRVKNLKSKLKEIEIPQILVSPKQRYHTNVVFGTALQDIAETMRGFYKRDCFEELYYYLNSDITDKVCIVYGLRRTGKTALIRQALLEMPKIQFDRCAYIKPIKSNTMGQLCDDIRELYDKKFRYIFIEDITSLDDFVQSASVLSDVFAATGVKIVLTSSEPFSFWQSIHNELYHRAIMIHTTFIPFKEYSRVMNTDDIGRYIECGGVLGEYNGSFDDECIGKDEGLTEALNNEINYICSKFLSKIITRDYIEGLLGITTKTSIWGRKDKQLQRVEITARNNQRAEELLKGLDFIMDCPMERIEESVTDMDDKLFYQPGRKYVFCKSLIDKYIEKLNFDTLNETEKTKVREDALEKIRESILKDIVLLETKNSISRRYKPFRLRFLEDDLDMVVYDKENNQCTIFEISNTKEIAPKQYRKLMEETKTNQVEKRFGKITAKYILYRGDDYFDDDKIIYLNVENYLKSL